MIKGSKLLQIYHDKLKLNFKSNFGRKAPEHVGDLLTYSVHVVPVRYICQSFAVRI